jgi:hypothetical protein
MKAITIVKYVFLTIGIAMLVGAGVAYKDVDAFVQGALSAEGTVVSLEKNKDSDSAVYKPVVQFTAQDGEQVKFTSSVGTNPPAYSVGDTVEVFYAPDDINDAKINDLFSLLGGVVILAAFGGVFFLLGAIIFMVGIFRNRKKLYLQRQGVAVEAEFQSVRLNRSIAVNGKNPFVIVCQWLNPMTGSVHLFESENLWFDPSSYISEHTFKVLIEKNNPKKYWIDISFLPKLQQ